MKTPFNFLTATGHVLFTQDRGVIALNRSNTAWEQRVLISAFERFKKVYPRTYGTYLVRSKQKGLHVITSAEPVI